MQRSLWRQVSHRVRVISLAAQAWAMPGGAQLQVCSLPLVLDTARCAWGPFVAG